MGGMPGALLLLILTLLYSFGLFLLNNSYQPPPLLDDTILATRLAHNYHRPRPSRGPHHTRHYGLRQKALSRLSHQSHTRSIKRTSPQESSPSPMDQWDCEPPPLAHSMDSYHRWVHMESHLLGLDTMFPSFSDLASLASTHLIHQDDLDFHHDPLRQFKTIQQLCGGSFLETTYKRKRTRWKSHTQQCMVAAATFSQTNDFLSVTRLLDSTNIPNFANLSKRMSIYLNNNGDDLLPIVIDSGASCSLTPNKHDFIGDIRPATISELRGLSNTTKVLGVGTVEWTIRDVFGAVRALKTEAYYVPEANIRLFSPQMYFHEQQKGQLVMNHSNTMLCLADGSTLVFPYNSQNNFLDPKLQDGKKLPKWQARARRGQYLGTSPDHSSTVGLIHNLRTGFISPQYHVIYDDLFSSVPNAESGGLPHAQEFTGEFWRRLIETGLESILPDDDVDSVPPLHHDWLTDAERAARLRDHDTHRLHLDPLIRPSVDGGTTTPSNNAPNQPRPSAPEGAHAPDTGPLAPEGASNPNDFDDINDEIIFADPSEDADDASISTTTSADDPDVARRRDHLSTPDPETHGRGKRHRKPNRHLFDERLWASTAYFPRGSSYPKQKVLREQLNSQFLQSLSWEQAMDTIKSSDLRRMEHVLLQNTNPYTNTIEEMHPMALSTKANAADHPTWEQAMNGSEAKGYWEACKKELHTLETKRDAWEVVQRQPWMKVLPSTWAFRCKRYPDGSVRKLKARFCARGDKQIEGVDCFDTFAPVVNWTTVRLMLILTLILNLATCQVDYTAAFVHAPIDTDVYLDMPRGFAEPNKVYRLKRSLYGLRQSPRNFFQHLKSKLEAVGLQSQEQVDPCLFMSDKVIVLVYVDDTLFYSPRKEWIDEVIKKIEKQDLELEIEDSVVGFLGVHIERNEKDGTIKLTQKGLIKRIIDALQIQHLPRKLTPATKEPLVADKEGMPPQGKFSYPSIIRMLQYLQGHSRPDITYAVSQCSRYTHNPKRSHEIALERIGQYLKHTQDEGLVLKPNHEHLNVDCFVDADFAGLWPYEDKQDPSCVKSRTGFTLCIANCPVIWTSKLQTDIATSTMEAEYNALSLAMKSVIPLQDLLRTIGKGIGMTNEQLTTFKTTVWEDNVGALTLANMEPGRVTPRSKFYAIKYHWFRSHLKPNKITVEKIATDQQRADIFTKGLTHGIFQNIRKLLCGW